MRTTILSIAAGLLVAGAAHAQCSKDESACTKEAEAKVTTVAQTSEECAKASESACTKGEAKITTVAQSTEECAKASKSACTKGEGAKTQTVAYEAGQECQKASSCEKGAEGATQSVAYQDGEAREKSCSQKTLMAANLPAMTCRVGNQVTHCPVEARELSSKSGETIAYEVAGQRYNEFEDAGKAYTTALTSHLDKMTRISFVVDGQCVACPMEAETKAAAMNTQVAYKVGPFTYECPKKAIRAAAIAYAAAQYPKMSMQVGEKATQCSVQAKQMAENSGACVKYKVGEQVVECKVQAGAMLAMARIQAALSALEQTNNAEG